MYKPSLPTVMVVEDDRAIQLGLRMALQHNGYNVVTADHGQEAIDLLANCTPDLILADIRMPVLNGLELLLHVKSDPSLSEVPMVIISASPGDQTAALDSGASYFLRKPFQHQVLYEIVESCCKQKTEETQHESKQVNQSANLDSLHEPHRAPPNRHVRQEASLKESLKILLIDDDQDFSDLICKALQRDGHDVTVSNNWLSLMRNLKLETPDVLLIDIETPTGNGLTAMEFMNTDAAVNKVHKAFVTGMSDSGTLQRCKALGAAHLHKAGDVIAKVRSFVGDCSEPSCLV